ncbi:hypothetical protein L7F22_020079 [Adiantum nelumboides]|nr:hypothetical protein [Adiantum nelumboides]
MVSYSRHKAKNPSPLISAFDWLRIFCSGCFGKIDQFKRPLLLGNPNDKLHLKMDNCVLQGCLRESMHGSTDHRHLPGPAVSLDRNDVVAEDDEDDDYDEGSDGMFHGHFLLGTKVLTELELQSPVEESRLLATPIRTPRRSSNSSSFTSSTIEHSGSSLSLDPRQSTDSSHTSLTRDPHLGSLQVCALDSASSSSLEETAEISPSQDAGTSLSPSMGVMLEENDVGLTYTSGRGCRRDYECPAAQLCKSDMDQGKISSSIACDLMANHSCRESNSLVNGEKVCLYLDDQQNNTTWNRRKCQARAGSTLECKIDDGYFGEKFDINHSDWVAAEKHRILPEGQDRAPVGSLPDCMSFNFLAERSPKKKGCRRSHARSLTDQDFTELKGCIDLGFVFPPDRVPDLRATLPALEVCYAVAHGAISPVGNLEDSKPLSPGSPPISAWRIASPGDQPQQVKARLRHWAQAVACSVRQP